MEVVNVDDLRTLAKRCLPKAVFEYVDGGAYAELTLERNRADLDALVLDERVMQDVSELSTATTMAGDCPAVPRVRPASNRA